MDLHGMQLYVSCIAFSDSQWASKSKKKSRPKKPWNEMNQFHGILYRIIFFHECERKQRYLAHTFLHWTEKNINFLVKLVFEFSKIMKYSYVCFDW